MTNERKTAVDSRTGSSKEAEPSAQPTTETTEGSDTRFIIGAVFDIAQTQEIETGTPMQAQSNPELAIA